MRSIVVIISPVVLLYNWKNIPWPSKLPIGVFCITRNNLDHASENDVNYLESRNLIKHISTSKPRCFWSPWMHILKTRWCPLRMFISGTTNFSLSTSVAPPATCYLRSYSPFSLGSTSLWLQLLSQSKSHEVSPCSS